MRALSVFRTFLRQKLRDRFSLVLTLLTAPAFVLAYWLFFADARPSFTVAVLEPSRVQASRVAHSGVSVPRPVVDRLRETLQGSALQVQSASSREELERTLRLGRATVGVIIPESFEAALAARGAPPAAAMVTGDAADPRFRVAAMMVERALETLGHAARGTMPPVLAQETPLGLSGRVSAFESYVPALLVFTVIMLIFSSSMAVVRQVEAGTLARVRLTPVGTAELLLGVSAVELLLGFCALLLTFLTARLLGFRSAGSLLLAFSVAELTSVATIGIGMFVASLSRNVIRAFLLASVAMFLLVLFSGLVFPRPRVPLFEVAARTVDLFDLLPTTHMGVALTKVMTLGASLADVVYELSALCAISALSFTLGGLFFARSGRPSARVWDGLP